MSSFATAASRSADKDTPNSKQLLHLLVNPEGMPEAENSATAAAAAEPARAEAPVVNPQTLDEAARVERLLTQLEARSMALVPYGYGNLREVAPRRSNTALLAGALVAIWATILILGIAYIRYVGHSPFSSAERTTVSVPTVIAPETDAQDQKVAASVDHLAKALVSSSERMNQLEAAVEKSNRDLQRIAKSNSERPAQTANTEQNEDSTSVVVSPTIPKNWHRVLEIKPTDMAVPHKTADGTIDYWLVPRNGDASPNKVLPIGKSADGVVVHNLDDGKDYTLTPNGEWKNGALAPAGN